MDSVSSPELAELFDRISSVIDLEGATNAWEIDSRMKDAIMRAKLKAKLSETKERREKFGHRAEQLDKLIEHDFPARVIIEARRHPEATIAQTLFYGKEKARLRVLAYRRRRARFATAYPRAGVRYPTARRPQREPVSRRMRVWRMTRR